jgi:hypothetical protein
MKKFFLLFFFWLFFLSLCGSRLGLVSHFLFSQSSTQNSVDSRPTRANQHLSPNRNEHAPLKNGELLFLPGGRPTAAGVSLHEFLASPTRRPATSNTNGPSYYSYCNRCDDQGEEISNLLFRSFWIFLFDPISAVSKRSEFLADDQYLRDGVHGNHTEQITWTNHLGVDSPNGHNRRNRYCSHNIGAVPFGIHSLWRRVAYFFIDSPFTPRRQVFPVILRRKSATINDLKISILKKGLILPQDQALYSFSYGLISKLPGSTQLRRININSGDRILVLLDEPFSAMIVRSFKTMLSPLTEMLLASIAFYSEVKFPEK